MDEEEINGISLAEESRKKGNENSGLMTRRYELLNFEMISHLKRVLHKRKKSTQVSVAVTG